MREWIEMKWQKIETAPKDGSALMLFGVTYWMFENEKSNIPHTSIGCWNGFNWMTETDNPYQDYIEPTHWMEIPDAPNEN